MENEYFEIWMEEEKLCVAGDLIEAVSVWFAAYYIFNVKFPPQHRNFLIFIQKVILKLGDGKKMSTKVFTLMKTIENNLS